MNGPNRAKINERAQQDPNESFSLPYNSYDIGILCLGDIRLKWLIFNANINLREFAAAYLRHPGVTRVKGRCRRAPIYVSSAAQDRAKSRKSAQNICVGGSYITSHHGMVKMDPLAIGNFRKNSKIIVVGKVVSGVQSLS